MQLIYDGKTPRSIPRVDFPSSFSLSANPKHFSNTEESIKVINEVIVPYITSKSRELGLHVNSPALLILDPRPNDTTSHFVISREKHSICKGD